MKLFSVNVSGNLVSESLLINLSMETSNNKFTKPESFSWYKFEREIDKKFYEFILNNAWENLLARWDLIRHEIEEYNISELRDKWLKYIFNQIGFNLTYQKADAVADSGNKFPLSHKGWDDEKAPYIHTVSFTQNLDSKVSDGRHKYTPHDTVQRYLNQSDKQLWSIVTNGRELRILRDFHHQTRKAYIKFDLEALFESRSFNDFRLLFRLIHPSRFLPCKDNNKVILEQFFEESRSSGVVVGEDLRGNIKQAIEKLGNGFLIDSPDLIGELVDNNEMADSFHKEILKVIYRVLFLLYAEQRNLMPSVNNLYLTEYSITALREKIEKRDRSEDNFFDLWEGLKVTFQMVYEGVEDLNVTQFNGLLFSPNSTTILNKYSCRNDYLLDAIKYMTIIDKNGTYERISYAELGVDEIGSIYESLLEFAPKVSSNDEIIEQGKNKKDIIVPANTFFLDPRGTNRKTSGSYYTNPGLVNELIKTALIPVLENKLKEVELKARNSKQTNEETKILKKEGVLSLKVCDPACGSAAFLIAATEYLGQQLAVIETGDNYPSDNEVRHARREVLRHCIYGVDLNPMSVELAKVSLWLTCATADQPLNFLDHKIKHGNSLIGATPELIKKGIVPEAYNPVEGDVKPICNARKKHVRDYYKTKVKLYSQSTLGFEETTLYDGLITSSPDLSYNHDENSSDDVESLKDDYQKYRESDGFKRNKFISDYWTASFFWKNSDDENHLELYPKPEILEGLFEGKIKVSGYVENEVNKLADEYHFFHWHLEFPEVFNRDDNGFDCVLGNPPWENLQPEEKQFFASIKDVIAESSGSKRKKLIEKLKNDDNNLFNKWIDFKNEIYNTIRFISNSSKYILTAKGKLNTYPVFSELFRSMLNNNGYAGIIVPTGIATDNSTKYFFGDLVDKRNIISLYDFENSKGIFQGVHRSFKFCQLTMCGQENKQEFRFSFFNTSLEQFNKKENAFTLTKEDFLSINPNTKTCPIFRSKRDAEIVKKIYSKFPVLINERTADNIYGVSFKQGLFNMTSDSNLFMTKKELENKKYILDRNIFIAGNDKYLPLYESKMIFHYNHRFGSYEKVPQDSVNTQLPRPKLEDYQDPEYLIIPRYWVDEKEVKQKTKKYNKKWFISFRDIARATDARTSIFTLIPYSSVGNNLPLLLTDLDINVNISFFANMTNFVFDYFTRQKISTTHLNFYILKQLPVIPPERYTKEITKFIKSRVLELTYTAYDLKPFAEDMGYDGEPFIWDEERRFDLKCDLDALYAHLYEITEDELDYIMETFPIVKRKDMDKYGEYRTKRVILEKFRLGIRY